MNHLDRQHLSNYEDILIKNTDFKRVFTLLLRWRVIPPHLQAFKDINLESESNEENNRILYEVIKTRGERAFTLLKRALGISNPELLEQFEGKRWRFSGEEWNCVPQVYNLSDGEVRGSYCIVSFTGRRSGWEKEVELLKGTFHSLQYEGSTCIDPVLADLDARLNDFSSGSSDAGCYVFALAGHGNCTHGDEVVRLQNGAFESINKILLKICKSRALQNKPKIIILQICRGDMESLSYPIKKITPPAEIPDMKDTIILRPCLPGYVAYRDSDLGGWFIKVLTDMIKLHAKVKDVEEIMIEVCKKFVEMREERTVSTN